MKRNPEERTVLTWPSTGQKWTEKDSYNHLLITGGVGSGKTSGSGRYVRRALLNNGAGMLMLTFKSEEVKALKQDAIDMGREDDLVIFGQDSGYNFNPLLYALNAENGSTDEVTELILHLSKQLERSSNHAKGEEFWEMGKRKLILNTLDLLDLANQPISFANINKILSTELSEKKASELLELFHAAFHGHEIFTPDQVNNKLAVLAHDNYLIDCLLKMKFIGELDNWQIERADQIFSFFTNELQGIGDRVKSIFVESVKGITSIFTDNRIVSETFTQGLSSEVIPEKTFEEGKIICLDFSIANFGKRTGTAIQSAYTHLWMKSVLRRKVSEETIPRGCYLFCDEAQWFVNSDFHFTATVSRSYKMGLILITQNLSNAYSVLPKENCDALLGVIGTHIIHTQSDQRTCQYYESKMGEVEVDKMSYSYSDRNHSANFSVNKVWEPALRKVDFSKLQMGGERKTRFTTEAIIWMNGKVFKNGKNYLRVKFKQH